MSRMIEIDKCNDCPFQDRTSGFSKGGSQAICNKADRKELPKVPILGRDGVTWHLAPNYEIPSWCPLPVVPVLCGDSDN